MPYLVASELPHQSAGGRFRALLERPLAMQSDMQTRAELYDMIGLHAYEELDASIIATVLPGERSPVGSPTARRDHPRG